jgi:hypothetical protein
MWWLQGGVANSENRSTTTDWIGDVENTKAHDIRGPSMNRGDRG